MMAIPTKPWPASMSTSDVLIELDSRIKYLEERLLVVEPQFEMMDKYPALREAYDEYKTIERLIIQEK